MYNDTSNSNFYGLTIKQNVEGKYGIIDKNKNGLLDFEYD